jgi:hypothetical protein
MELAGLEPATSWVRSILPTSEKSSPRPDPRMDELVAAVAGLQRQIGQLADQVTELRERREGRSGRAVS